MKWKQIILLTLLMIMLVSTVSAQFFGIRNQPPGLVPSLYCKVSGCDFTGNINILGNILHNGTIENVTLSNVVLNNITINQALMVNSTDVTNPIWVETAGDEMTGTLNMLGNQIINVSNIIIIWDNNTQEIFSREGYPDTLNISSILPEANNTGNIGELDRRWNQGYFQKLNVSEIGGYSPIIVSADIISAGIINATFLAGDGSNITGIKFNGTTASFAGDVAINGSLSVAGPTILSNLSAQNITAIFFIGDGSQINGLGGDLSGVLGNAQINSMVITTYELNLSNITLASFTNDVGYVTVDTRWVINGPYLYNNSGNLDFNATLLAETILSTAQVFNESSYIDAVNTTQNIENLGFSQGNSSPWLTNGPNIIYSDSETKVGINTSNPLATLHVVGDANVTGNLSVGTGTLIITNQGIYFPDDTFQPTAAVPPVAAGWNGTNPVKTYLINDSAFVGVGTEFPIEKFHVIGNILANTFLSNDNNWSNISIFESQIIDLQHVNISGINQTLNDLNATILAVAQVYNDTLFIQAVNTTANIESLGFFTGEHTNLTFQDILNFGFVTGPINHTIDTRWVINGPYLYNNSGNLDLNESKLNATIDARQTGFDTNETVRFNNLVSFDCPGTYKVAGVLDNGTLLCAVDIDTDTRWSIIGPYLVNQSGNLVFNESKLNLTIGVLGVDYSWIVGNGILYNSTNGTKVGIGTATPNSILNVKGYQINVSRNQSNGPVAHYRFEDKIGYSVMDSTKYENTAQVKTQLFATSKGGNQTGSQSMRFNLDNFVHADSSNITSVLNNLTTTAWVYVSSSGNQFISSRLVNSTNGYGFFIDNSDRLGLSILRNGVYTRFRTSTNVPVGSWVFVAATYNAPSNITLYISGTQQPLTNTNINVLGGSRDFFIGSSPDLVYPFSGFIDEVTLWNRSLSLSELTSIRNSGVNLTVVNTPRLSMSPILVEGFSKPNQNAKMISSDEEGNLGIAIENPNFALHVGGLARFTRDAHFENDIAVDGTIFGGSPVKITGGAIISGGLQVPNGNLNVTDNLSVQSTLVAQEIVDLTPAYSRNETEALRELTEIKYYVDRDGTKVINHSTLPDFARVATERGEGRSLGAMISVLTESTKALKKENDDLRTQVKNMSETIKKLDYYQELLLDINSVVLVELCDRDPTYSWCVPVVGR